MYKIITVTNIKTYILQIYKKYNITKDCCTLGKKNIKAFKGISKLWRLYQVQIT